MLQPDLICRFQGRFRAKKQPVCRLQIAFDFLYALNLMQLFNFLYDIAGKMVADMNEPVFKMARRIEQPEQLHHRHADVFMIIRKRLKIFISIDIFRQARPLAERIDTFPGLAFDKSDIVRRLGDDADYSALIE